jgi:hypothetical protein
VSRALSVNDSECQIVVEVEERRGREMDVLDFFPDISFHLIPKSGKKSFFPFSFFREKSLFFTCPDLFLPDEKAPNETDHSHQKKQEKKCNYDFFWEELFLE